MMADYTRSYILREATPDAGDITSARGFIVIKKEILRWD